MPNAAQGFATLLAITLKRHIVLELVCKHPQCQRIEALFSGRCLGDESQQVANELGCHKKPFGGVFAQVLRKVWQVEGPGSSPYVGMIRFKFAGSVSPSQPAMCPHGMHPGAISF
jgi:hypothetical protein